MEATGSVPPRALYLCTELTRLTSKHLLQLFTSSLLKRSGYIQRLDSIYIYFSDKVTYQLCPKSSKDCCKFVNWAFFHL